MNIADLGNELRCEFPSSFLKTIDLNLLDFDVWYIMTEEQMRIRFKGLSKRYPKRELIPFARRDDSDDIACFERSNMEKVYIIHDFAGAGYEQREEYTDFFEWFKVAIDLLITNNKSM